MRGNVRCVGMWDVDNRYFFCAFSYNRHHSMEAPVYTTFRVSAPDLWLTLARARLSDPGVQSAQASQTDWKSSWFSLSYEEKCLCEAEHDDLSHRWRARASSVLQLFFPCSLAHLVMSMFEATGCVNDGCVMCSYFVSKWAPMTHMVAEPAVKHLLEERREKDTKRRREGCVVRRWFDENHPG